MIHVPVAGAPWGTAASSWATRFMHTFLDQRCAFLLMTWPIRMDTRPLLDELLTRLSTGGPNWFPAVKGTGMTPSAVIISDSRALFTAWLNTTTDGVCDLTKT